MTNNISRVDYNNIRAELLKGLQDAAVLIVNEAYDRGFDKSGGVDSCAALDNIAVCGNTDALQERLNAIATQYIDTALLTKNAPSYSIRTWHWYEFDMETDWLSFCENADACVYFEDERWVNYNDEIRSLTDVTHELCKVYDIEAPANSEDLMTFWNVNTVTCAGEYTLQDRHKAARYRDFARRQEDHSNWTIDQVITNNKHVGVPTYGKFKAATPKENKAAEVDAHLEDYMPIGTWVFSQQIYADGMAEGFTYSQIYHGLVRMGCTHNGRKRDGSAWKRNK